MSIADMAAASDGELRQVAAKIEREVQRREGLDADARALAFRTEMDETDRGVRVPYDERVAAASPAQVTRWLEQGQLRHLGYGQSKRRGAR